MKYKFLEHTADIKFQAFGGSLNTLFQNCAAAVSHTLTQGKKISEKKKSSVRIEAENLESLLYQFLEHIILKIDIDSFLTAKTKVKIKEVSKNVFILQADFIGDFASKYEIDQIKAPTYHEMYIRKSKEGFKAQVVMDV